MNEPSYVQIIDDFHELKSCFYFYADAMSALMDEVNPNSPSNYGSSLVAYDIKERFGRLDELLKSLPHDTPTNIVILNSPTLEET
ncbi:MAG: hypothetical protein RIT27_2140 [Pseudomonadota bacterium]|jgi:hypothetical protein